MRPGSARHGRRGGHEEEHEEHENHERWLVSYADMMTLLMVLFIVMFAISSINQGKFNQLKQGLHNGFGTPQTMLAGGSDLLESGGAVAPDAPAGRRAHPGRRGRRRRQLLEGREPRRRWPSSCTPRSRPRCARRWRTCKQGEGARSRPPWPGRGCPAAPRSASTSAGSSSPIATDKVLFDSASARLLPQGRRHPRRAGADARHAAEPAERRRPHELPADRDRPLPLELGAVDRPGDRRAAVPRGAGQGPGRLGWSAAGYADTRPLLPGVGPPGGGREPAGGDRRPREPSTTARAGPSRSWGTRPTARPAPPPARGPAQS